MCDHWYSPFLKTSLWLGYYFQSHHYPSFLKLALELTNMVQTDSWYVGMQVLHVNLHIFSCLMIRTQFLLFCLFPPPSSCAPFSGRFTTAEIVGIAVGGAAGLILIILFLLLILCACCLCCKKSECKWLIRHQTHDRIPPTGQCPTLLGHKSNMLVCWQIIMLGYMSYIPIEVCFSILH